MIKILLTRIFSRNPILTGLFALLWLAACADPENVYLRENYGSQKAPKTYVVKRGDTLFSISWRFGVEQEDLMARNNIADPSRIYSGQKLRIATGKPKKSTQKTRKEPTNSKSTSKASSIATRGDWVWPMSGRILREFNANAIGGSGMRIAGKPEQSVNATEAGTVVYQGSGLNGYGNVIIIKHSNNMLSAYGFLSSTLVKKGDVVKKRQKLGTVGKINKNTLALHFEVRRNGEPTNPKRYIGQHYHF